MPKAGGQREVRIRRVRLEVDGFLGPIRGGFESSCAELRSGHEIEIHMIVRVTGAELQTSVVKGCRMPAAAERCHCLGRQVSDKPRGRKPRVGYAGWRGLLWGKCDWLAWLDRTVGFDACAAGQSRRPSNCRDGAIAAVETVDGSLRPYAFTAALGGHLIVDGAGL